MKSLKGLCVGLLCLFLSGCQQATLTDHEQRVSAWFEESGRLKVLSSIAMIHDIVSRVGGEHVDSLPLVTGQLDPHTYEMVKGDGEKLGRADIVFFNGLGLEHGPSLRRFLDESSKSVALGDSIARRAPERILVVDGATDPHIWMDISLWALSIDSIVEALSEKAPEHAHAFKLNGDRLRREMEDAHNVVRNVMLKIPQERRYLVTSHDAFNYFARAYLSGEDESTYEQWTKRFQAPDGLAPDGQMSTTDIREILTHLKAYEITMIFPESNVSQDAIRKIVESGKAEGLTVEIADVALYGDAMGERGSGADTYLGMIEYNARVIAQHLK